MHVPRGQHQPVQIGIDEWLVELFSLLRGIEREVPFVHDHFGRAMLRQSAICHEQRGTG